jgi:ATP-dependent Clp protease ATP-binding subunit ClpA
MDTEIVFMSHRPFTTKAQLALRLADHEAAQLRHDYVGTEHILLALLAKQTGIAAAILQHAGVTAELVHQLLRQSQSPSTSRDGHHDQPSNDR